MELKMINKYKPTEWMHKDTYKELTLKEDEMSAEKELKTESLFEALNKAKHNIATAVSNKYFEDEYYFYWIGETLSICDEFLDLEDIKYALENDVEEKVIFNFLEKSRKYNLEDYCLGKVGRKAKKKEELKNIQDRLHLTEKSFQETLLEMGIEEPFKTK